ncbi:hypothetical protein V1522DRAFT_332636, partial [Lipomyces starkeyi]
FFSRHEIVGMTGDGVNNAPSLKAADICIALCSGSDIAIEASDMVRLDKFYAIVEAVEYGRVVFDNLKNTVAYLLQAGSYAEFWPVITNVVLGLPQILSSFLMIVIWCVTFVEYFCMCAMSYLYLQRQGIPFSTLWLGVGAIPDGMWSDLYKQKLEASSIYFVNLVVMQWFNLMAVRTRRQSIFQMPPLFNKETQNLYLFPAIFFARLMAFFWLYIPKFQTTLGTTSVPAIHFFLPMCFGLCILVLEEGR